VLFFVVGTGRCGSTLVTEILARHPDVGFISNLDDKLSRLDLSGRWNNALFRRAAPRDPYLLPFRNRRRLLEPSRLRIAPSEGWEVLERQVSPIISNTFRDLEADDLTPWLATRLRQFFDRRMAAQHRSWFLHHFTGWPRTGLLQAAFPDARFVHVVRDGRAVANSWLQMPWWSGYSGPSNWYLGPLPQPYGREFEDAGGSYVLLAGLAWKLLMDAFERARAAIPSEQWLDVRVEDVSADPRGQFAAILKFLELEWTSGFEAGFARHHFDSDRREAFRRDLDPRDLAMLEGSLRDHLETLGYRVGAG
jgi:Sulfotransferase family